MDRAVTCIPNVPRKYLSYGSIFRASPTGVWGDPSQASVEIGKLVYDRGAELMVKQLEDAFRYMDNKEQFNYSHF
jgi:creatinine amidohydrolase